MLFNDVINLISITETVNNIGDTVKTEAEKQVYANRQSIRQNEFYQAMSLGLRPELMFVIRSCDYNGEPIAEYKEKKYNIIRVYDKGEMTELICQGLINKNAGT